MDTDELIAKTVERIVEKSATQTAEKLVDAIWPTLVDELIQAMNREVFERGKTK